LQIVPYDLLKLFAGLTAECAIKARHDGENKQWRVMRDPSACYAQALSDS